MDLSTVSFKSATALSESSKQTSSGLHCTWVQKFSGIWRNGSRPQSSNQAARVRDGRRVIQLHPLRPSAKA